MRAFRFSLAAVFVCACSSTSPTTTADAGPVDAGADDAADAAAPYPAPHPPLPQVLKGKGPVMTAPKFVPITFKGDPLVADIDDFMAKMGAAKSYWAGATAEYGVGPATTLPPIHATDVPAASIADSDIQTWLTTQIMSPTFPQPDDNTIYTLFYADGITVTMGGGVGCQDFEGYHNDFMLPSGKHVVYSVSPRCPPPVKKDTLTDMMAAITSHELVEAATDPFPEDDPTYIDIDPDHVGWSLITGGTEVGDLCAPFPGVFSRTMPDINYLVQRTWSNQAAAAGHDPCAPNGVSPYFNSAPVLNDTIAVVTPAGKMMTKGVKIPVGQSATVELDLYSDAPTSGPWTVSAIDWEAMYMGAPGTLAFSFDKTTGQNGDVIQMTITVMQKGALGQEPFWIQNTLGSQTTVWLGVVGN